MRAQLLRFALSGVAGFLVDASVLWIALHLGLGYFVGRIPSFLAAVWTTWRINRRFTFAGRPKLSAWQEWWRYLAAMSAGACINYSAYSVTVLTLPHTSELPFIGLVVGSLAGMVVNFISARWWVFRH